MLCSLQTNQLNQLLHATLALGSGHVEQTTVKVERLLGRQELVQVRFLGQIPNPLVLAGLAGILVKHQDSAAGREQQPEDQLDGGRFSAAVGTEQPENLTLADLDIERLQRVDLFAAPEIAVNLAQVASFDDDTRVGPGCIGLRRGGCFRLCDRG